MNALLLWAGDHLFWIASEGDRPQPFRIVGSPVEVASFLLVGGLDDVPSGLRAAVSPKKSHEVDAFDSVSRRLLAEHAAPLTKETIGRFRRARARLPDVAWASLRRTALALADRRLAEALSSPTEVLITLAREEERVERGLGREAGAADQWISGAARPLLEYQQDWEAARRVLEAHHRRLVARLDAQARVVAPNLSALVGTRVASRLIAAAGGIEPLARMSAGRLQLLGTRRRPGRGRGPRFGILVRAEGMGAIPEGRQGAFARSLAALAVVAARADALTHRDVSDILAARKLNRSSSLRRRRRS